MTKQTTPYQQVREDAGLNLHTAVELGIDSDLLRCFEHGIAEPDAVTLRHMAELYNISADTLLGIVN